MFAAAVPMGHFGLGQVKAASFTIRVVQLELERLKRTPAILTEQYLDCLNKILEPLAIVQGTSGLRIWLHEVQHLMGLLKQRSFNGIPLMSRERQVLQWYSARWRELRGGPCDLGRPEAQIVLLALGELSVF